MVMVTTTGYIIDIFGPFEANKNDATIIHILLEDNEFLNFMSNTVAIVDRGFRDVKTELEEKNVTCLRCLKNKNNFQQ
jgi:hypothetical protein